MDEYHAATGKYQRETGHRVTRDTDSPENSYDRGTTGIISHMIETSLSPTLPATVLHRVTGVIDQQQAQQGAADALQYVLHLSSAHGQLNLVLDLRGKHFQDLQAHKAWSQGFARNPALHGRVRYVAI